MIDFTNGKLMAFILFDILGLSFAIWWLGGRVKSKISEVEKRQEKAWHKNEEE
ncbi:MAG: hypothetical protein ABGX29_01540 [Candidatus Poseidoniia archaeon]|jgi:hypothetical protein|tara:strand:+ start:305 stop:463 length:159 start_codon:yes stop_codon:yes gene_type:complete